MSANYPADAQITNLATSWNQNPAAMFAYCAYYQGQLPANVSDLNTFTSMLQSSATGMGIDVRLLYGYVTQYGTIGTHDIITNWAKAANYMDASGNVLYIPAAGQNFIGDIAVTGAPPPPPAPTTTPPPPTVAGVTLPPFDLSSLTKNPIAVGAAGLAVLYVLNPGHWRGR